MTAPKNRRYLEEVAKFAQQEIMQQVDSQQAQQMREAMLDWKQRSGKPDMLKVAEAYGRFAYLFRQGGEWDLKKSIERHFGIHWFYDDKTPDRKPRKYFYDIWGNISYGFIGHYIGFETKELLNAGGVVQAVTLSSRLKDVIAFLSTDFGNLSVLDDPKDQKAVEIGIELSDLGGRTLFLDKMLSMVRASHAQLNAALI